MKLHLLLALATILISCGDSDEKEEMKNWEEVIMGLEVPSQSKTDTTISDQQKVSP